MDATTSQIYISLLEKTNQQLSLWTNPYGILVGALAILFTVLTIVAVFIILRQGKEYKDYYQKTVSEYRNVLKAEIQLISDNAKKSLQLMVDSGNKEVERLKAIKDPTPEQVKKIEALQASVKKLHDEKDLYSSRLILSGNSDFDSGLLNFKPKNDFNISVPLDLTPRYINTLGSCSCGSFLSSFGNYCSNCGKKQI